LTPATWVKPWSTSLDFLWVSFDFVFFTLKTYLHLIVFVLPMLLRLMSFQVPRDSRVVRSVLTESYHSSLSGHDSMCLKELGSVASVIRLDTSAAPTLVSCR